MLPQILVFARMTLFILALTIVAIYIGWYLGYQNSNEAKRIEAGDNAIAAILNLRIVRSKIKLHCKARPNDANDQAFVKECAQKLYKAREGLKELDTHLLSAEVVQQIHDFYIWDASFTAHDVCIWNAPSDDEYRQRQKEIEVLVKSEASF